MKPNQQTIFTAIFAIVIVGLMAFVIASSSKLIDTPTETNLPENEEIVYSKNINIYYGITCPHCKDVDNWIDENQAEEILEISQKEVYQNKQNSNELLQVATSCGLNTNSIGVPFMFAEGKCFSGKFEIIDYLENQLQLATEVDSTQENSEVVQEEVEDEKN